MTDKHEERTIYEDRTKEDRRGQRKTEYKTEQQRTKEKDNSGQTKKGKDKITKRSERNNE
jgi:hypothetical protein